MCNPFDLRGVLWCRGIAPGGNTTMKKRSTTLRNKTTCISLERLEGREMLAASPLRINGTGSADTIRIALTASVGGAQPGTFDVTVNGVTRTFNLINVSAVNVSGGNGNDSIVVDETNGRFNLPMNVSGGAGNDSIATGSGNDVVSGGDGDDTIFTSNGNDSIKGDGGNDNLDGGAGTDRVDGGKGNDVVKGGDGADTLLGSDGTDTLTGGTGADIFTGGKGADVFSDVVLTGASPDKITDLKSEDSVAGQTNRPAYNKVDDYAMVLKNINLSSIAASKFDLVIIDESADGTEATRFTKAQIESLYGSGSTSKRVLAYLNVGYADPNRFYWNDAWDANDDGTPDAGAPSFLGTRDAATGLYNVRYWQAGWQAIVEQMVTRVVNNGFDGVLLDGAGAVNFWGPAGASGENRTTAAKDFADLITEVGVIGRTDLQKSDFGLFARNVNNLSGVSSMVSAVNGILQDNVIFDGNNKRRSSASLSTLNNQLKPFKTAGKLRLDAEFVTGSSNVSTAYKSGKSNGYVAYVTNSTFSGLTVSSGFSPT